VEGIVPLHHFMGVEMKLKESISRVVTLEEELFRYFKGPYYRIL